MNLTKQFFKYVSQNIFGLLGTSCYILADTYFIAQTNDTAMIAGVSVSAGGVSPSAKAAMGSASSNIAISAANSRFIYFPPVSWS